MKSIYTRNQEEFFLDGEERSVEDEKSFEEGSKEEEEEKPNSDGNNYYTNKVRPGHQYNLGQKRHTGKKQESD